MRVTFQNLIDLENGITNMHLAAKSLGSVAEEDKHQRWKRID